MNCPVCNIQLNMMERQGVEIDYCSKCRGVWLDRGELDKIIERSAVASPGAGSASPNQSQDNYNQSGFNQPNQSGFNQPNQSGFNQPNQSGFNQPYQSGFNQSHRIHDSDPPHYGHHKKHKKRESFLSDLFDF
ncbi:MAG: zf-TFIIB domain-containing protein [Acidobacteriota bacterium]|nr:zf-TFIIB domain-containing protein [Acidobacteriota bacterium]